MSLPQSVQAQADLANRHFQNLETPDDPDAQQASAEGDGSQGDENLTEREQGNEPTDPAPEPREQPEGREGDADYWKHRHSVEAGRLRQANDENRALKQENQRLNERVRELEAQPAANDNAPSNTDEALARFRDEYGDDLAGDIQELIKSSLAEQRRQEQAERQREQEQQNQQSFMQLLARRVPNWQQINNDPAFLQWLGQRDADGRTRQERLNEAAHVEQDPYAVADIFEQFLRQAQNPQPQQQPEAESRGVPDDQVQPRQSRSTQTPGGERIWTNAEIHRFYEDRRRGVYSAEEGRRLELDIEAAFQQGRVQR